jgi:transcriptional regulator with XRE-family HTH domain
MPIYARMEEWFEEEGRAALGRARRADRLNQTEFASRLGISQPYLSKLLAGKRKPSPALKARIHAYLSNRPRVAAGDAPEWARDALELAGSSPDFRDLLRAALKLFQA